VKVQAWMISCLLILQGGCGKPPADLPTVPIHPVSGVVTLDGQPIEGARLSLISLQGQKPGDITPNGISDAEGKFQISTYAVGDGAPDGAYAIIVSWPEIRNAGGSEPEYGKERLPPKYQQPEKSGFVVTVSEDLLDPVNLELKKK
jgi:hypothetical protein